MFRTKKDVDRHAQDVHRKVKSETERMLKYYNLAKLYYQVGDYESARRYASGYLSVRDNSACGHKLLGQTLEALGQKDKALAQYKCSLILDRNQSDLVLKVCELMTEGEITDKGTGQYWCDQAEQLFPHNPVVFKLKEKLLRCEGETNSAQLETLIAGELAARPTDVTLHVRLLKLYLEQDRVNEAFTQALEEESKATFREELSWYITLDEILKAYKQQNHGEIGWEFYLHYTSVLERVACLTLREQYDGPRRGFADCVQAIFRFDQVLEEASGQNPPSSEQDLYQIFLTHQRGQLCLHFATLLLKRAKKERSNWREVCRVVAPLLLLAMSPPPDQNGSWLLHATKTRRKAAEWWVKEGAYRNSQAGHVILGLIRRENRTQFKDHVRQFCSGNWRERVYQKIFNTRDHQQAIGSSHFVKHSSFIEPQPELPSILDLRPHDETSQKLHPSSLHHMVWLGLREFTNKRLGSSAGKLGPDFRCLVFETLQLTCNNLVMCGVETLNRLDIDAFLYAAVLCAKANLEEQQAAGFSNDDRPSTLPANITEMLCTVDQAKWWSAAYRVYTNQSRGDLGELRQTLQRGIEVVRVLGNHGLDVRLIVQLARTFTDRASSMATRTEASVELTAVEARASLYWTSAMPLLDRLQRNQAIRSPHTRLFEYQGKELSMAEINTLIEEGRFFLACQIMKEGKYEKALEAFSQLKSPDASFYQAQIYKRLAAQEVEEKRGELITSEMRSQHIILLAKVRESLYLTLDRLRSPGVDPKHPLNAVISTHIEEIESQLARIDPDVCRGDVNRNDLDALSDGSVSSEHSGGDNINSFSGYMNHSSYMTPKLLNGTRLNGTPYRSSNRPEWDSPAQDFTRRTEARPSPERLEAQIRQIMHGRDSHMQTLVQQNKAILESIKDMASSMSKIVDGFDEVKTLIQELVKKESKRHDVHNTSDLPQVDNEEDLYVFDDDYSEDVSAATSHLNQYQPFPPYPNYPGYRPMSGMLGGSAVAYGPPPPGEAGAGPPPLLPPGSAMGGFFRNMDPALMYPQTLGYYSQGALPFSEGQQLPDFRAAPGFSRLGAAVSAADSPNLHKLVQTPVAPVNVVITSSDTLPTTAPLTQPTLSVTIPPQHRLGTPLVHTVPMLGHPVMPPPPPPPAVVMSLAATQPAYPQSVPSLAPTVSAPVSSASGVPHAFQISMPPQAQLPIASRLEKGAAALSPVLPISTQTLLSSVPSPVYSAVVPDRSPASKETAPKQHRVSTGSATGEEEEGVENDHDPCPDFQPVIPLPAEVEVNTGEEDEKVIFENRCKLYRFVEKEWKERGVGLLKLLHHKETGKVRILMRREQVLKVCANHILSPDIELSPMGDRAWMWAANDFADEKMQLEKLCARFKTADEAANFYDAFNKGRELARNAKSSPGPKPSVAQKDRTPSSSSARSEKFSSTTTSSTSSTTPDKIVVGGFTFAAPPIFSASQIAKDSTKEEKKVASPKPSPFASCFFGTTSSKLQSSTDTKEGDEGSTKPSLLGSKPDSSTGEVTSSQTEKNKPVDSVGGRLMFNSSVDVSFSTLASAAKESPFKTDSPFKGFDGAGQPVFGGSQLSRTTATPKSAETGEEGSADDFVPTAEFKPVVPLPELVEVRTGEEGEEILYQERAKLLRFDSDAKEWKERGTGQMKVLKDPKTDRIRLLMRREQVLKVCCNHQLLRSMQFKSLATSDKAWTWCAQDYSEGEVKRETFAIRFKTVEQAKSFKDTIDKCQVDMKDSASAPHENRVPTNWHCEKCLFSNEAGIGKCQSCSEPRYDTESHKKEQPKLSELFRPPPGSWECSVCYTRNSAGVHKCVSCCNPNASQTSTESRPQIEIIDSPKSNMWKCSKCNFNNEDSLQNCDSCSADRSDGSKKALSSKQSNASPKPLSEMFKPSVGSWECKTCYIRNSSHTITCVACSTPKPGHEATVAAREASPGSLTFGIQPGSAGGFSFGIPAGSGDSGGFKFGIPQSTSTSATPTSSSTLSTGLFSTPTTKEFIFGIPTVTPAVSTAPKTTTTTASTTTTTITTTTSGPMIDASKLSEKPFVFEHKTSTPFQFGSFGPTTTEGNAKTAFNFGSSSNKESGQLPDGSQPNFVFGSSGDFKFNFSGVRPKSPVKSPKSPGVVIGSGGEDESGSEQDDDEGEHIYFQPVIPMPDKVPLHTGEEDEDVLYCHRAKLFRFLGGEWKERGVGDVKILKNRTTHKIRLLMRREQVLKLCLNHLLTPEMNFLEKDEKSWLWNASDFSDGELQQEKFAIRFVSKEVALSFKEAVEKAKSELKVTPKKDLSAGLSEQPVTSTPHSTKEQGAVNGKQSPAKSFTFTLSSGSGSSETTPKLKAGEISGKGDVARTLFEDISADSDGLLNATDESEGQEPEEDEVQEVYRLTVTPEERARALQLMLPENFFSYKQKPPCRGCCGCEPDSDAEEQQSSKTATPSGVNDKPKKGVLSPPQLSVPSVPKTTVSSIFSAAATNHVFGQPANFGLSTKGSLFSQPSTQEGPMTSIFGQRSASAQQFATMTPATTFSFGASTTASVFKLGTQTVTTTASVFDQTSSSSSSSSSISSSIFTLTPSTTTISTTTTTTSSLFSFGSYSAAPVFTLSSTATPTSSVSEPLTTTVVATTSAVPATTSLFSSQSFTQPRIPTTSTTSVFGSDKPLLGQSPAAFPKVTSIFGQPATDTKPTTASIFGSVPSSASSSVSATPVFGLRPAESEATSTAASTSASSFFFSKSTFTSATPTEPSKPFTFEFTKPPPATTASDLTTSEFKPKLGQLFSQPPPAQQPATVAKTKESEGVPFLPTNDSLTFASVASKASEVTFGSTGSGPFQWANAGATIFGNSPLTRSPRSVTVGNSGPQTTPTSRKGGDSDHEEDDDGTGGGDDGTYDPHYEPIIALPDAIEVRTGEEEEEKVFCQRAKLYRYEVASKQWKERGVGEMKLLKHPDQGSYRLLLRREQVHKVVCNMRVTADLELKPLSTSDRTWCWGGMNHAEEEACVEQLAVRFKHPETAQEFYNKVCEAVQDVAGRVNSSLVIESVRSTVSSGTDEEDLEDVEDEEDDGEEDEDDDGMERSLMFEKRATLSTKQPSDQTWTTLGQGDLRVIYDQDYYAARIVHEADGTGNLLCNNLIASNTELEVKKKCCTWSALDCVEETPVQRIFMARFSSERAAQEFEQIFMEAKEMATQSSLMDNMDPLQVLGD